MTSASPASCCSASKVPARAPRPTRLAEHYGVAHLSTGDMFRAQAAAGHRVRARGQALHGRRRARARRDRRRGHRGVHWRRAARSATASCSTASRARCRRRASSTGCSRARRSTSSINLDVPARDRARPHRRPAGLRELPARVPRQPAARPCNWTCDTCGGKVRPARRRHRRGGRAPARAVRAGDGADHRLLPRRKACSTTVDGVGEGDDVFERLVNVVDEHARRAAEPMILRKTHAQIARDAAGRAGRRRDARGVHPSGQARCDDRRSRRRGTRGARSPRRAVELPQLPRLPGGRVHLAQRGDRARHPRRPGARGGRHRLDRLRRDHRGLARRRRDHDSRRRRRRRVAAPDRHHPGRRSTPRSPAAVEGNRLGDIGAAVEGVATARGFAVVREYVGHGIGTAMHEEPEVPNYGPAGRGMRLQDGHGPRDRADGQRRQGARPGPSPTAGPSSPPTAPAPPTSSTPWPSPKGPGDPHAAVSYRCRRGPGWRSTDVR